eukprot:scaffold294444_cov179-Cyclotella_meneghiniana.AAC.1
MSDEEFVSNVQTATTDWGLLVQATGGAVKQSKSFWYLLSWKFLKGKACLKTKEELMHHVVTIPQTDGTEAEL